MKSKFIFGAVLALGAVLGIVAYQWMPSAYAQGTPQVDTKIAIHMGKHFTRWKNPGRAPFVPFKDKNGKPIPQVDRRKIAEASDGVVLKAQQAPVEVQNGLMKKIALNPDGEEITYAQDGDRYLGITYSDKTGPSITKNVVVDFGRKVGKHDDKRKVARWFYTDSKGQLWVYDRFGWWCINSGIKMKPPKRVVKVKCAQIPFSYTGQSDVAWDEGAAHVTAEVNMSDDELDDFIDDECTGVIANGHFHKVLPGCWGDCDGAMYPPDEIADIVGLPHGKPTNSYHFGCAGDCVLQVPLSYIRSTLFCVTVEPYRGVRGWMAFSRFDPVYKDEFRATIPHGRLRRTLTGSLSYQVPVED